MRYQKIALAWLVPLVAAIWPLPSTYTNGADALWIEDSVVFTYTTPLSKAAVLTAGNTANVASGSVPSTRIVQTAVQRAYKTIFSQNFVPWMLHPRDSNYEPSGSRTYVNSVSLVQTGASPAGILKPVDGALNESYTLDMTTTGAVTITAETAVGLAYGLTTFTQLFYAASSGGVYTNLAPVQIADSPKFVHRGLNLDVARSFYPVAAIKRTIDALAYNKMNRLHLHIIDSQSWPLEITSMPELAAKGAYGTDLIYSPADLRGIQSYGSLLGVEVYIETEMPGHSASIALSHPELIAAFNVQPAWNTYAAEPPSGTLKLNDSAVYTFLDAMLDDVLPRLSPYTSYYHTGGDEVNFEAYTLDPTVNSSDPAVIEPLIQKLIDNVHSKIRAAGFIPMVWEEMLLNYNVNLGSDVVVQTWLSDASVASVVQSGHKALAGNYLFWYLDCGEGQWLDFEVGAASEVFWPYADYCSPRKNWRLIYSYDPLSGVPSNLEHLVLGGEVHMWSEQTDAISLDRAVWPRASAAGEVLWSGAKDAAGNNRSQITASPRLAEMRERLVARGVMAETVHMPFCTQNGTQCVLWNQYA